MNASTQTQTIRINVRTEQEQVDLGAALGQGPGTSTDRSLLGCSRGKRRCALPSPFLFRENWQSNYRSDQLLKGSLLHFAYLPGRILCDSGIALEFDHGPLDSTSTLAIPYQKGLFYATWVA
ncbi:hypothetical protein SCLCIDRAFT_1216309 [Scleroderma citrinum Foug A]|uniref:Uncharacterized protein n=1 Tax=Scleroderma citrinum Foug A TaxID=1036808 RepID=A0A0C3DYP1_9AGAM|nr:hypothetical protein SCLCIDRAFT_1216309 [Scleroderma citrinum Foug A]